MESTGEADHNKQTVGVEHIHTEFAKAFANVRAALERSRPHLDPGLVNALADVERADRQKTEGPELPFLGPRSWRAAKDLGKTHNAFQYYIGNPVTSSRPRSP